MTSGEWRPAFWRPFTLSYSAKEAKLQRFDQALLSMGAQENELSVQIFHCSVSVESQPARGWRAFEDLTSIVSKLRHLEPETTSSMTRHLSTLERNADEPPRPLSVLYNIAKPKNHIKQRY